MIKQDSIIIDLDGTLANCSHRLHHVQNKPKKWHKFFLELIKDQVNEWCKTIIQKFKFDHKILLVSGRPEDYRNLTEQWLKNNNIYYDRLIMRKKGDYRSDDIVKEELYKEFIEKDYKVLFTVDDRERVVKTWRKLGLTCLQCNEGDF